MKCNYSYEVLRNIHTAMLGRMVDNGMIDMDKAKDCALAFETFINIMQTNKKLVNEFKEIGAKAFKEG